MNIWLQHAAQPTIYKASIKTALFVGTLLVLINYSDKIIGGHLVPADIVKMLITYCVPFCVSTHAAVKVSMANAKA